MSRERSFALIWEPCVVLLREKTQHILHQTWQCLVSKFAAKNNLSYAVENYGIQIKLRAVCFRGKYKNKTKTKFTPALDRTGYCLFKKSDNLNFVEIKKFKDCVSVSNNLCLKYVCKQCVSSEDIISTVHIRIRLFARFSWSEARTHVKTAMLHLHSIAKYFIG